MGAGPLVRISISVLIKLGVPGIPTNHDALRTLAGSPDGKIVAGRWATDAISRGRKMTLTAEYSRRVLDRALEVALAGADNFPPVDTETLAENIAALPVNKWVRELLHTRLVEQWDESRSPLSGADA